MIYFILKNASGARTDFADVAVLESVWSKSPIQISRNAFRLAGDNVNWYSIMLRLKLPWYFSTIWPRSNKVGLLHIICCKATECVRMHTNANAKAKTWVIHRQFSIFKLLKRCRDLERFHVKNHVRSTYSSIFLYFHVRYNHYSTNIKRELLKIILKWYFWIYYYI